MRHLDRLAVEIAGIDNSAATHLHRGDHTLCPADFEVDETEIAGLASTNF
jgi:hypothetical protein